METKPQTIKELIKENPNSLISQAYFFAENAHKGQKRLSGEPYFNHPLKVAENLINLNLDEQTIAAGLLHDTIEDTNTNLEDIRKKFGDQIAFLIDGVTKIGKIKYRGVENQKENIKKLIIALSEDIRVVFIKLSDRLHNMQTLKTLSPEKQKRIALETYEIYAPLAYRLGMHKLSGELEDLAFPYLYPNEHRWLINNIKEKYSERENYLKRIKPLVIKALEKAGIKPIHIDFRAKRYASLYKKLLRYEMDISKIHDLVALRIVVQTISDCYAALGLIHNLWPPLPGRIKDYIAMPKPNGYRSIHTTVFCVDQKIVEFQIRTLEMHEEAEHGQAASWKYSETKETKEYLEKKSVSTPEKEIEWVKKLRDWQKETGDSPDFIDSLKVDFFKDRIFAITPKGTVVDLPAGATPIDFAYQIHSDIGNQCVGAKVNNHIVPLEYELRSGDIVEIIIQKGKKPSASWLNFVKKSSVKNRIKKNLKNSQFKTQEPKQIELKIVAENKTELLKNILTTISYSRINVKRVSSNVDNRGQFQTIKIICKIDDRLSSGHRLSGGHRLSSGHKQKISKLILKLKEVKNVKEIDYRFV